MSGLGQGWLVAQREVRERSRSRGFRAGLAVMLLVVVAAIVVPSMLETTPVSDIGLAGTVPEELSRAVAAQAEALDVAVRVHRYDDVVAGEDAVRDDRVDVLVVDAQRLEWQGEPQEDLRVVVTGAIQLLAIQDRASAAGIGRRPVLL